MPFTRDPVEVRQIRLFVYYSLFGGLNLLIPGWKSVALEAFFDLKLSYCCLCIFNNFWLCLTPARLGCFATALSRGYFTGLCHGSSDSYPPDSWIQVKHGCEQKRVHDLNPEEKLCSINCSQLLGMSFGGAINSFRNLGYFAKCTTPS